jgi:acyl carrier protein
VEEVLSNRLPKVFQDVFGLANLELSASTTADDIPDWDSLTHVQLIIALEKEFSIRFALGELQEVRNVGALAEVISKKITFED